MRNKIAPNISVIILLGVILSLNILSIQHKTSTYDERYHYRYGCNILKLDSNREVDSTMPFSSLNAIPRGISILLRPTPIPQKFISFLYGLKAARLITMLFSLLLGFYVFSWSKELYGFVPGLFSLILYTFSPNIIAHSRLVTGDFYGVCMTTISTYYFWRFIKFGGLKNAALSAFTLGLSQLARYTCIFLYPIFLFILLVRYGGSLMALIKTEDFKGLWKYLRSFLKFALIFIVISIIIINAGFLFNRVFTPLGEYRFRSDLFKTLQSKFIILKHLPIPLPYPYVEGLDWLIFNERNGEGFGNLYLLGKLQTKGEGYKGFKGYYFYAFLFKVPIATQLFILFSFIAYILKRKEYNFLENELFLFLPVLFFTIYFNFFFKLQIGIRIFLVVFAFLHIFCASLLRNWGAFSLKLKSAVAFLVLYLVISVLSYFPHYLSYFNELVWDRKQAYKILADSNIDWGQNRWYLERYKQRHPDIHVNPEFPLAGRIVVGVNRLVGIFEPERYRWLRDNFKPIDHIAYSYLVYDISPEDLKRERPLKGHP